MCWTPPSRNPASWPMVSQGWDSSVSLGQQPLNLSRPQCSLLENGQNSILTTNTPVLGLQRGINYAVLHGELNRGEKLGSERQDSPVTLYCPGPRLILVISVPLSQEEEHSAQSPMSELREAWSLLLGPPPNMKNYAGLCNPKRGISSAPKLGAFCIQLIPSSRCCTCLELLVGAPWVAECAGPPTVWPPAVPGPCRLFGGSVLPSGGLSRQCQQPPKCRVPTSLGTSLRRLESLPPSLPQVASP